MDTKKTPRKRRKLAAFVAFCALALGMAEPAGALNFLISDGGYRCSHLTNHRVAARSICQGR